MTKRKTKNLFSWEKWATGRESDQLTPKKNEIKLREEPIGPGLRKGKNLMEKICRQHTSI